MANLVLRQEAIDDLSDIWNYTTKKWSVNQADKYYGMIKAACKQIATDSTVGRSYHEIYNGLLGFKVGKHIVFYRHVENDEIEVIRILHERMDLVNRLTN